MILTSPCTNNVAFELTFFDNSDGFLEKAL
jgi:hypothetical protein